MAPVRHPLVRIFILLLWLILYPCDTSATGIVQMVQDNARTFHAWNTKPVPSHFSFAKHFQSHMVLQQAPHRANIYGFSSDIGDTVKITIVAPSGTMHYETKVVKGPEGYPGVWNVTLDPMGPGGPITIQAKSASDTIRLEDVLFGDVWICSGQSNMQFAVSRMFGAEEEIANAHKYPDIRFMNVYRKGSATPLHNLFAVDQPWTAPTNKTISQFSAVCWLYGKAIYEALGYPIGLVGTNYGGTPVEAWSSPDALAKCGIHQTETRIPELSFWDKQLINGPSDNSVLWNAMVYPLLGMTIYGSIWYQGESDSVSPTRMNRYNCTFPAMIDDWRLKFNSGSSGQTSLKFPFGFVQLATSMPPQNPGYVDIRWHQTADVGFVPNKRLSEVFMAVALDLPDFDSPSGPVHTRHKKEVGQRLSLSGLAVAYKKKIMFQGPFPQRAEISPNSTVVTIDYGEQTSLDVRNVEGFELLCSSGNHSNKTWWLPTGIVHYTSQQVTLQVVCGVGQKVLGLRYEWQTTPCALQTCAIYSQVNQLPAPPFISFAQNTDSERTFFLFPES